MDIRASQQVTKGIVMMLVAVFFFSFMDIVIKWLSHHYSSFQVSFFRGASSLPFFLIWIVVTKQVKLLKTHRLGLHVARGLMSVLFLIGVVVGLRELELVNAYAIFFASPLLVAVLSIIFLDEKVGVHRWAAILIGLIGVIVALKPTGGTVFSLGAVACLLSVVGYSFTVILIKKMSATENTFSMVIYFLLCVSAGSGVLAIFDWHPLQWEHWPYLLALGLTGALGQYFLTEAFQCAPASVIAPLDYSALIWGAMFGYFIWGEVPLINIWVGAAIIIGSGLYLMYRESLVAKVAAEKSD